MEIKNIISSFTLGLISSFSISAQDTIYDEKYEQLLHSNISHSLLPSENNNDLEILPKNDIQKTLG